MNNYYLIAAGLALSCGAIAALRWRKRRKKRRLYEKVCDILKSTWAQGNGHSISRPAWMLDKDVRRKLAEMGVALGYAEFHILMNEMELDYEIESEDCHEMRCLGNPLPRKFRILVPPLRI